MRTLKLQKALAKSKLRELLGAGRLVFLPRQNMRRHVKVASKMWPEGYYMTLYFRGYKDL